MFWKRKQHRREASSSCDDSSLQVLAGRRADHQKKIDFRRQCIKKAPFSAFNTRPARFGFSMGHGISSRRPKAGNNNPIAATNSKSNKPQDSSVLTHRDGCPVLVPMKYDPTIQLDTYTFLLSLNDISLNAMGLEKLLQACKPPEITSSSSSDATSTTNTQPPIKVDLGDKQAARAIIYGGDPNSAEEHLHYTFLGYLCDINSGTTEEDNDETMERVDVSTFELEEEHNQQDEELYYSDDEDEDEQRCAHLRDTNWGVLHYMALKVLASSLEQVLATTPLEHVLDPLDFSKHSTFWPSIVNTLQFNIRNTELLHSDKITGISLKCLRLLYSFQPAVIQHILQHTLMPYIVYLDDYYGSVEHHRKNHREVSRLLKRMRSCRHLYQPEDQAANVPASSQCDPSGGHPESPISTTMDEEDNATDGSSRGSKEEGPHHRRIESKAPDESEAPAAGTCNESLESNATKHNTEDDDTRPEKAQQAAPQHHTDAPIKWAKMNGEDHTTTVHSCKGEGALHVQDEGDDGSATTATCEESLDISARHAMVEYYVIHQPKQSRLTHI